MATPSDLVKAGQAPLDLPTEALVKADLAMPQVQALAEKLKPKWRLFADLYLLSLNLRQAALGAGYSDKTALTASRKLLARPEIKAYVEAAIEARAARLALRADRMLAELKAVALSSLDHYEIDEQGRVCVKDGAPPEAMAAVSQVRRHVRVLPDGSTEVRTEIKLWDKPAALALALKHLGQLVDRVDVTSQGEKIDPAPKQVFVINGQPVEF